MEQTDKMEHSQNTAVRILGRTLGREITVEEIEQVAGGAMTITVCGPGRKECPAPHTDADLP